MFDEKSRQESTWRDAFDKYLKEKKKPHPNDKPVSFPHGVEYIYEWFMELNQGRSSNGFGPNPISFTEIKAWSDLNQIVLSSLEIAMIKMLDTEFCFWVSKVSEHNSKDKKTVKK